MKRCVVHIGMHKTGTTSIQNSLNLYEDPSFYYARIGGHGNHSVPVYSLFSEHPERHNLNRHRGQNPAVMAQYIQSIKADLERSISEAGDRTLIISGEDIGILKEADIARMHDALRPHYDDIQILAYVRPPMSFMNSALQQMVRSGGRAVLNFDKLYRSYRASYEKFDNVFGRDAVMLKLFDRKELRGGDVVKDFCATIGLDFPPDRIKRDNESSSRETVCLMFQYNRFCSENDFEPMPGTGTQWLSAVFKRIGDSKFRLSPAVLRGVVGANTDDIAWIEERMGRSLAEPEGVEQAGDIRSEDDLLAPVPGARGVLLECLAEIDVADPGSGVSDAELLHMLRKAVLGKEVPRRVKPQRKQRPAGSRDAPGAVQVRAGVREPQAAGQRRAGVREAAANAVDRPPRPLLNAERSIMVMWSPRAAASAVYSWFAHVSGFADELREYGDQVQLHRAQRYFTSPMFKNAKAANSRAFKTLKVIRDPYDRAVSIFFNAIATGALNAHVPAFATGGAPHQGMSFNAFLDFLEEAGVAGPINKIRMQYVPLERKHPPQFVINISKQNLLDELNRFEAFAGLPETDFAALGCASLKPQRQPQARVKLDLGATCAEAVRITQRQARSGELPEPKDLLTDQTKARIREIYRIDFDAYHSYL